MIEYLEFEINGATIKSCFTRMTEEDNWVCQIQNTTLEDLQMIVDKDF